MTKTNKNKFDKEAKINFLKEVPILKNIPDEMLLEVCDKCVCKNFRKGELVYKKGDPPNWVYFVYSGHVAEFVGYSSSVEIIVKTRKKYDYIGEMGALIDQSYPNTAIALEAVTLLAISKEVFLKIVHNNISVMKHINEALIDRLVKSSKNIINVMYLDASGRLAFILVGLVNDKNGDIDSLIRVTHSELASTAGMARQTASLLLGEWRDQGIVETTRGGIRVLDLDRLMDIIIDSELR